MTYEELYEFRLMYNVALFNEWAMGFDQKSEVVIGEGSAYMTIPLNSPQDVKYNTHKSWKHSDGEYCFGSEKEWFIVSAMLPTGLISNHYKAEHWELFKIPEVERAMFEYDGHTTKDVIERLKNL